MVKGNRAVCAKSVPESYLQAKPISYFFHKILLQIFLTYVGQEAISTTTISYNVIGGFSTLETKAVEYGHNLPI